MEKGFTTGKDNPQFEAVIVTPVRENNGVFSFAVQVSQEDAAKIAELFSQTECENKKLLYGQNGNLVYVRASKLGTYPDGCDYQGKVYLSIRLQENRWLQPFCFATETAKAKADAEKVANQKVIQETVTTINIRSRAFGLDKDFVGQIELAAKLGFTATDLVQALAISKAKKVEVDPADVAGGENNAPF